MPRWSIEVSRNRQAAIVNGDETYQGSPCVHGHPGIRMTKYNGKCLDCHKEGRRYYWKNHEKCRDRYLRDIDKILWRGARSRAKKRGLDFDLELTDVMIPELCPISGEPMIPRTPHAPSIDRLNNSEGYIKGNVAIISKRMNAIKGAATLSELKKLVAYMEMAELLK